MSCLRNARSTSTAGFENYIASWSTGPTECLLNCCVDGEHTLSRWRCPRETQMCRLWRKSQARSMERGRQPRCETWRCTGHRGLPLGSPSLWSTYSKSAHWCRWPRCPTVYILEESPQRFGRNNTTYECMTALLEDSMQHRRRQKQHDT